MRNSLGLDYRQHELSPTDSSCAKNSIGLVRSDSTTNELTVVAGPRGETPMKVK
jgi:hypothetical protein